MTFSLDQFSLRDKVAIVTGAGGRRNSIGEAYAKGLSGVGAAVVVADLSLEGAQRVAAEITAGGGKAISVQVDIADQTSVGRMVAAAEAAYGGVDILVNNAALMVEVVSTPAMAITEEAWNKVIAVNLTGALFCSQAVAPSMRKRGGGKIVNQSSAGAYPAASVYGITKLALVGLTTTLARELGPHNINVNAIAPGVTGSDAGRSLTPPDSPYRAMMKMMTAMRVDGEPDELVGALLLLCSPAGAWITGQVLHLDGGATLRP